MKKMRFVLSLMLLICILWGCSSQVDVNRSPYLSQEERDAIENAVLNNLEFTADDYTVTASFRNGSDYTLLDVQVVSVESDDIFFSLPRLDKGSAGNVRIYYASSQDEIRESDENDTVYLVYTIGEYTYYSDLKVPIRKVTEESSHMQTSRISIMTKDGKTELDLSTPLDFPAGTEIDGLTEYKIYSIQPEIPYDGTILLHLTGSQPKNYYSNDLVAKLRDEDGTVVYSERVYFFEEQSTLYLFEIEPQKYTLTFEESK